MKQNNFLRISLLFWIIVGTSLINLFFNDKYAELLALEQKIYFILTCVGVYLVASMLFFSLKKFWSRSEVILQSGDEVTYFESKIQYYIITTVALFFFAFLHFTDIGGFADIVIYLLWVSLVAFVFVLLFSPSQITLNSKGFRYEKGWKSMSAEWNAVKGIHANPAPSLPALAFHNMTSTSFLIETDKGVTGYMDGATMKVKGQYSPFVSSGDTLIKQLTDYSKVNLTVGTYSELRDSKNKKLNWIIAVILLILIVVSFYYATRVS